MFDPVPLVASEVELPEHKVAAVIALLAEGNTIPFIARYRKEATGNLDEVEIRKIQERYNYVMELESRRQTILKSIDEQGKLTPSLKAQIEACDSKTVLEDLYLPYKPKRRTRATIAKERGLEPLAEKIREQGPDGSPEDADAFIDAEKEVPDRETALKGARDIVAEWIAEDSDQRALVRERISETGCIHSKAAKGHEDEKTKFNQYYEFSEPLSKIPSHRYLAIRRGEREGVLDVHLDVEEESLVHDMERLAGVQRSSPWSGQLKEAVAESYRRLLFSSVSTDVRVAMKMDADRTAVDVFSDNLRNLLMAAPFGGRRVIGIDPGLRTGCKVVAVDETGKYLDTMLFNLAKGDFATRRAADELSAFIVKFQPDAIAVGNGTAGRETEAFVKKLVKDMGLSDVLVISVSESGASVYSASDVAREEFPDLDLTVRGAISIGRRLQDPLAELVKVDPKSIGVGQYQHDVHQALLADQLEAVVESCVNAVGVELNTASAPLLSHVAGVGASLAKRIVDYRNQNGAFKSRDELLSVPGLGPRSYEQAAGFLRVRTSSNPLDRSAVHPERYSLIEQVASEQGVSLAELVGNAQTVDAIDWNSYQSDAIGLHTLKDIRDELKKPGRDPRANFERPSFRDDVNELSDLNPGMQLEGVVTNVTAFGAFVDVGVHQDGLVHISQLSDKFVKDPHEVVKVGDKIQVKVLEIDMDRKRVSLTARKDGAALAHQGGGASKGTKQGSSSGAGQGAKRRQGGGRFNHNPFANL